MRKKKLIVMICFLVIVAVLIGVSVVTQKKYIHHCLPELLSEHCCTATAIWN